MTTPEQWDAAQCADHCAMKPSTWRAMVSRNQAPAALAEHRVSDGRKCWDADVVRDWQLQRPGPGRRTDIRDRSLATSTDPHYALGRLCGAAAVMQHHRGADAVRRAHEKVIEDAHLTRTLLDDLRHECLADTRRTRSPDIRHRSRVAVLVAELWDAVSALPLGHLTTDQQMQVILGYHHQHSVLT